MNSRKDREKISEQLKNKFNVMVSVALYYGMSFSFIICKCSIALYLKQSQGLLNQLSMVNKW